MYSIILIIGALLILSLFTTNWPVKFYHHAVLKKVGRSIGARPVHGSLFWAGVYSEIHAVAAGREIRIRYLEGSMDALHSNAGLEMRVPYTQPLIIEFYRAKLKKRAWGEFQRVLTADAAFDRDWVILSNQQQQARIFIEQAGALDHPFAMMLKNRHIEQILFDTREMIVRFQKGDPVGAVSEVLRLLPELTGEANH